MHATADLSNVTARLFTYAATLTLTGTPVMVYGGFGAHREKVPSTSPFVRWTVEPLQGQTSGRWDGNEVAVSESVLFIADLFWPVATSDAYQIDRVLSEIRSGMTLLSLDLLDYATSPTSPPTLSSRLRVLAPPSPQRIGTIDGEDRRRVTATVIWISRHTA